MDHPRPPKPVLSDWTIEPTRPGAPVVRAENAGHASQLIMFALGITRWPVGCKAVPVTEATKAASQVEPASAAS